MTQNEGRGSTRILCLPGDGIGPELTDATMMVLDRVNEKFSLGLVFERGEIGLASLQKTGTTFPEDVFEKASTARWRGAGAGFSQQLSAGRAGRTQSLRRPAPPPRSLCQHPSRPVPGGIYAALRKADRSGHRPGKYRGLLRRPLDVYGTRRVHADAGSGAIHSQGDAAGLDPDCRAGVRAGRGAPPQGHRRSQGECVADVRRLVPRMRPRRGQPISRRRV